MTKSQDRWQDNFLCTHFIHNHTRQYDLSHEHTLRKEFWLSVSLLHFIQSSSSFSPWGTIFMLLSICCLPVLVDLQIPLFPLSRSNSFVLPSTEKVSGQSSLKQPILKFSLSELIILCFLSKQYCLLLRHMVGHYQCLPFKDYQESNGCYEDDDNSKHKHHPSQHQVQSIFADHSVPAPLIMWLWCLGSCHGSWCCSCWCCWVENLLSCQVSHSRVW